MKGIEFKFKVTSLTERVSKLGLIDKEVSLGSLHSAFSKTLKKNTLKDFFQPLNRLIVTAVFPRQSRYLATHKTSVDS